MHKTTIFEKFEISKNSKVQNSEKFDFEKPEILTISKIAEMDSAHKNEPKTVFSVNGYTKLS